MIAVMKAPIRSASGKVAGLKAGYHARTNKITKRVTVAKNGSPFTRYEPTEAQLAVQRRFAEARRKGLRRW